MKKNLRKDAKARNDTIQASKGKKEKPWREKRFKGEAHYKNGKKQWATVKTKSLDGYKGKKIEV